MRTEIDGDAVRDHAAAVQGDSQLLPDPAVAPIGAHHVTGPHPVDLPRIAVANEGCHAVRILLKGNHLGPEAEMRTQFLGSRFEQRFQQTLRDEQPNGRAHVPYAFVQVGNDRRELLARQRLHGHKGAVLNELLF